MANRLLFMARTYLAMSGARGLVQVDLLKLLLGRLQIGQAAGGQRVCVAHPSLTLGREWLLSRLRKLRTELDGKQIRIVALDLPTSWMLANPGDDFTGRMFG